MNNAELMRVYSAAIKPKEDGWFVNALRAVAEAAVADDRAAGAEAVAWVTECPHSGELDIDCKSSDVIPGGRLKAGDKLYLHPPAAPVPEGYVLMPVEPTEAMLNAARYAPIPAVYWDSISANERMRIGVIYRAMLAASQEVKNVE